MIFSIAILGFRDHYLQPRKMVRTLEAQVLMSGIEVDGWQLFLKEAMGGLIRAACQLCLGFFFLPNLDLCQNSVMFSGRFSRDLGVCNRISSQLWKIHCWSQLFPPKTGVVVTLTVENTPQNWYVWRPDRKTKTLTTSLARLTNNQAPKQLGELSRPRHVPPPELKV